MKGSLDVSQALLGRGITHEIVRLRRPVLSADELPEAMGIEAAQCVAVRLYTADQRTLLAVLMRAGEVPDPEHLAIATASAELRPAPAGLVNQATEFAAALVCPLLLPAHIPVLCDAAVGLVEVVYTATGEAGTALGIPTLELLRQTNARVTDLRGPVPTPYLVDVPPHHEFELLGAYPADRH